MYWNQESLYFSFQRISNAQLQTELVDILKNMFLPSKKMIKEQIEWLIEHKYMKRDEDNINMFIYMAWKDRQKSQQTYAKHRSLGLDSGWTDLCCAALPKKSISLSAAA